MTRKEQVLKASQDYLKVHFQNDLQAFIDGAEWADANPDISENSKISTLIRLIQNGDKLIDQLKQMLAIAEGVLEVIAKGSLPYLAAHAEEALAKIEEMKNEVL